MAATVTRYVFDPAHGLGHGQAHAGDADLAARPAQPPDVAAGLRAFLAAVPDLTDVQQAAISAVLDRTMADLDLAPGTEVEVVPNPEANGWVLIAWTDKHGDARCTSIAEAEFAAHFAPQEA